MTPRIRLPLAWSMPACGGFGHVDPLQIMNVCDSPEIRRIRCAEPPGQGWCPGGEILWGYDATPVFGAFTREVALDVAPMWMAPPGVLQYLRTGSNRQSAASQIGQEVEAKNYFWRTLEERVRSARAAAAWATADPDLYGTNRIAVHTARAAASAQGTVAHPKTTKYARRLSQLLIAGRRLYGQRVVP